MVPRGQDSSTLNRSRILIRVAGGAASQMQLCSPERADYGCPWVPAPSGGRAALRLGEEVSGSPCRPASALQFQCWLKLSLECAHKSVPGGLLARAIKVVESLSLLASGTARSHRWDEEDKLTRRRRHACSGWRLEPGWPQTPGGFLSVQTSLTWPPLSSVPLGHST